MYTNRTMAFGFLLILSSGCGDDKRDETSTGELLSGAPSILLDLDPDSPAMTFTVENITADEQGLSFFSDRESGNVLRVDPAARTPVVVGKIEDRTDRVERARPRKSRLRFDVRHRRTRSQRLATGWR